MTTLNTNRHLFNNIGASFLLFVLTMIFAEASHSASAECSIYSGVLRINIEKESYPMNCKFVVDVRSPNMIWNYYNCVAKVDAIKPNNNQIATVCEINVPMGATCQVSSADCSR